MDRPTVATAVDRRTAQHPTDRPMVQAARTAQAQVARTVRVRMARARTAQVHTTASNAYVAFSFPAPLSYQNTYSPHRP